MPLVVKADGTIVCGHGRYLAAHDLGLETLQVIIVDHLSDAELKAFMIAETKLTENAEWDSIKLGEIFLDLSAQNLDLDIEITGFTTPEIDLTIEGLKAKDKPDEDDVLPALPLGSAITQAGNLWTLGNHRLLCGDALNPEAYNLLMQGEKAAMIFTDPPFNVRIDGHVSGLGAIKHREFAMATGEMSRAAFTAFLTKIMALMAAYSHDGSIHYVCMDWRHMAELLTAGDEAYTELKNICVWAKDNGGMGSLYRSQHEMVGVFKHGKGPHRNNVELGKYGRNRTNVWSYPGINTLSKQSDEGRLLALHPTVKPVKLVADAILDVSARGEIVLDAFMGSGTTLMAAERVGRKAYGLEIDPHYVDTIIRRWEAMTGDKAVHVETGKTFNDVEAERG